MAGEQKCSHGAVKPFDLAIMMCGKIFFCYLELKSKPFFVCVKFLLNTVNISKG
jgi:hypothetical protein